MKNLLVVFLIGFFALSSCTTEKIVEKTIIVHDTVVVNKFDYDYMLMAVLWYQTSAEMRALCYQAFNTARISLDDAIANHKGTKKMAVVVDIDETMVDNSPYEAQNVLGNFGYPERWGEWIDKASAAAIPGAVEFMKYAVSKGVDVFYISNRKIAEKDATIKNMRALGFPLIDDEHLLLRDKTSSKNERRDKVAATHDIVLLIGDNMNDFSGDFENKSVIDRFNTTDNNKSEFGKHFIVLPNPMYGDWEGAVLKYNFKQTNEQKDSVRKENLKGM
ncbi:Lipoprotein E [bioreactor metagenome]|uniref:Lipoprotein E n=1 Tax=bioreactor metagenome TaxID=1076179 RepID=A0A644W9R3_9ZZZZ